jgi:ring-1,2-phenylacetyl-CoA epoxidase subunit PaaD
VVIDMGASEADVRAVLATVPDPEIPVLSVVDLGIVHRVAVRPDRIDVAILPTFVGCPALDVIRATIAERLEERFGRDVRVETTFEVPWTSDRITAERPQGPSRGGDRTTRRSVGYALPVLR